MILYRSGLCWALAIVGVALAGIFEVIDQASMTTLLIALPVAGWMAVRGRECCPIGRKA